MTPLNWGAATEVGLVRAVNEDSKLHKPPLFVVADGMGGHSAGDVASGIAVDTLNAEGVQSPGALQEGVRSANAAIYEKAKSEEGLSGMGTTIIAMYAGPDSAQIVHVGDCRAYLLRAGALTRLTQDHTVVERLVQEGRILPEDADRHPKRSFLERALGVEPHVDIDVKAMDTQAADRFMLCSDGLFGMISDDQIKAVLTSEEDPKKAAGRLCDEAVAAGGRDNVTAIVVDYPGPAPGATGSLAPPAGGGPRQAAGPAGLTGPPGESREGRPRKRRRMFWVAAVTVLLTAGGLGAAYSLRNSWYLGISHRRVAVFQGLHGSIAGVDLSRRVAVSDLEVARLPDLYQKRLEGGIAAGSRPDAQATVKNLERLAAPPAGPSPSPAQPAPSASPTPVTPGAPPP